MDFANIDATRKLQLQDVIDGNQAGRQVLEYPLNNREYPARIIFKVIPNQSTSVANVAKDLVEGTSNIVSGLANKTSTINDPSEIKESNFTSEPGKGLDLAVGAVDGLKAFHKEATSLYGNVKEEAPYDERSDKTTHQVSLYLPTAIAVQDAAQYDNVELGIIGGVAEQALQQGKSVFRETGGAFYGMAANEIGGFISGNSSMGGGMADILAQKRAAKFGPIGQSAALGMQAASKVTTNPNTRAMFKDTPIRTFSFNFSLIPTSAKEAEEIKKIVKLFRTELYPTVLSAGKVRIGYKFPNRFKIQLKSGMRNAKKNDDMNVKFLPTYLTAFSATYNANSPLLHVDGNFNQVDVAMTFSETRALTKADVRDGGY